MRRFTILAGIAVVATTAACIDMSAPSGGPASISLLQLPAAFVVAGDTMRDSAGRVMPLGVIAYDGSGAVIANARPRFFVTDSVAFAHIDTVTNVLVGDSSGIVHVIGQVGNLQTPVVTIPVTVAPTTLAANAIDTLAAPLSGDTTAHGTESVGVRVTGATDSTVQGVIVHFALLDTLPSTDPSRLAAYLVDDQANVSGLDTTDVSGNAARTLVIVPARIAQGTPNPIVLRVEATATYRGARLAGSPVIISVPVKVGR